MNDGHPEWRTARGGPEVIYPHAEGGRDPLARFERSLGDLSEQTRERFYAGNLAQLLDS